ncbi:hypothetical protein KTO58_12630 [Chitinophaga pendula]|uniref:tyrosine-protein phosphatase n=1 Tax=Chitinophaga TaxID=79328 RepID=UPI0012FE47F1|nr:MULTISPECIES: CpsB/CapC family capsule biosynthesis tyrosine phosphatase [Chitinophaga]UCJ10003.1 hypothetical protein KTO58_12630 [Chitinophaga pendula]
MFLFGSKRSKEESEKDFLSFIGTDLHSHLVPGIDDGVQDADTSIRFIRQLADWGIQRIITTPHIMTDRYDNSKQTIDPPFEALQQRLRQEKLPVPVSYAAEYYLDEHLSTTMATPMLTLNGSMVLVEVSFVSPPLHLPQWLFDLETGGYTPLLAHPERYIYYQQHEEEYDTLKRRGCLFQLNLLSLTGYYGRHVQKAAQYLINNNMIDYIGTDLHHDKHLEAIRKIAGNKKVRKVLEKYPFKNASLLPAVNQHTPASGG